MINSKILLNRYGGYQKISGPFVTPNIFIPDTYAQSGQVNLNFAAVAAFINYCLNNATYGNGAPTTLYAENAVYFNTSSTPYQVYVQHNGAWVPFGGGSGSGSVLTVTDGIHTVNNVTTIAIEGASVVSGTTPNATINVTQLWRIQGSYEGTPSANQEFFYFPTYGDEILPIYLTGSRGGCETAPTGNVQFEIYKSGVSIGTMNIASGQTVATFTFSNTVSFSNTDFFSFNAPSSADATLTTPFWCFSGTRG